MSEESMEAEICTLIHNNDTVTKDMILISGRYINNTVTVAMIPDGWIRGGEDDIIRSRDFHFSGHKFYRVHKALHGSVPTRSNGMRGIQGSFIIRKILRHPVYLVT